MKIRNIVTAMSLLTAGAIGGQAGEEVIAPSTSGPSAACHSGWIDTTAVTEHTVTYTCQLGDNLVVQDSEGVFQRALVNGQWVEDESQVPNW